MIIRQILLTVSLVFTGCVSKPAPTPAPAASSSHAHPGGGVLRETAPDASGRGIIVIKDSDTGKPIKLNYQIYDPKYRKK